jgi:hypothetical protein
MGRNPTVGFKVVAPEREQPRIVVGDLFRRVAELAHAPEPLSGIQELVCSASYRDAARRYLQEMEASGMGSVLITQRMEEETPFTRVRLSGELAQLPPDTALYATTPAQERICAAALAAARRGDVEGFQLNPERGRERVFLLARALTEVVEVIDRHHFIPAYLLPPNSRELFERGR